MTNLCFRITLKHVFTSMQIDEQGEDTIETKGAHKLKEMMKYYPVIAKNTP